MKIRFNVLQRFSMLMMFLIFTTSFPLIATAQYDSIEAAKIAAKTDAKTDANKFAWFATGCGVGLLTFYLGNLLIDRHISTLSPAYELQASGYSSPEFDRNLDEIDETFAAGLVGCGTAVFGVTYWLSSNLQPSPPAARLVGKSPQYVDAYTNAYMQQRGEIESTWTFWGLAAGGGAGLIYLLSNLD